MRLTFLGATGTVTGSKYLVEVPSARVLVDCGLFQGYKQLRLRNWAALPVDPKTIDAVILTHAHLDHTGYLPVLVRGGFHGPVFCTSATQDLCSLLLPDSGYLQEKDAEYANRHGFSKHRPAKPLYTEAEAKASLRLFRTVDYHRDAQLSGGITLGLAPSGHILGSAFVSLTVKGTKLVFSGDLGRPRNAIMLDPEPIAAAEYLVVESTYGDRRHTDLDPESALAEVIDQTAARGGVILIPAFAVGRTQTLLYHLHRLAAAKRIPAVPIYLDSPMAVDASKIFCEHRDSHRLSEDECHAACNVARYVTSVEESKDLDRRKGPMIIISASGMATGGRVLHHLKAFAPDAANTVLLTGYQAGGTRGAAMLAGAPTLKIHGQQVPVRAQIRQLDMLSAHADWFETLEWLRHFERAPRETFITHGEPDAADALRQRIQEQLGWPVAVPEYRETTVLD
jgi:metallo-beta-lactamase family protein